MKPSSRPCGSFPLRVFVASTCLSLALVVGAETAVADQLSPQNLASNGDFEQGAKGWGEESLKRKGAALHSEATNTWLTLTGYSSINQHIALDPEWLYLRVTMRMRTKDVVQGTEGWHDARLAMSFADRKGQHVDPWPNVFHAQGTTEWTRYERVFKVPPGAAALDLSPSMFGASGQAEFDDIVVAVVGTRSGQTVDLPLPAGAEDLGELTGAWRQSSRTRETICLNGLWRFVPVFTETAQAPPGQDHGWGWFKVPGLWPKSADDAQQILLPIGLDDGDLRKLEEAWYQRPLNIPAPWLGRRIFLDFTMIQTHARVLLDGQPAGELFFPGGLLEITAMAKPGQRQVLSVLLTARPLEKESNVFMAPDRIVSSQAALRCKGLTGDVWLVSQPTVDAVGNVQVITSTRRNTIAFDVALQNTGVGRRTLEASVYDGSQLVKTFTGGSFDAATLPKGRVTVTGSWPNAKRWDLHTPQHLYTAIVALRNERGAVLDESLPIRFGFREFWIDGRDFYLNGSRIHLRFIHLTNLANAADQSSLEGSRNTCRRLQEYGFNAFITSNYSFGPGEVGYLDGLFTAADEAGVLASFSLPHVKDFAWKLKTPQQAQRYRTLCEWLIRRAQNHPSIVLYAMNHNATGYKGDQNPLWMDGVYSPDEEWAKTAPAKLHNRQQAALAADIAQGLDPTRPVYHHQSGNLGQLYTVNIYLNWAPRQERSDWLEHWATHGVKPMFFVEWGLPHVSSWSSYRGPQFIWRSPALQQIWDSEYAAAYVGQEAYRMTPTKVKSLAWEEELWAKGQPFPWSNLIRDFRSQDENYTRVQALFAADNWRSHRTWGISAMLPWDQENLWRAPREAGQRVAVPRPYADLQRPGISPDRVAAVEREWIYSREVTGIKPSAVGQAFLRWNTPLCAYVAGGGEAFTDKGHNFRPGDTIYKSLALLNDTRQAVVCRYRWSLAGTAAQGQGAVQIEAGGKVLQPVTIPLPESQAPGRYVLSATFDFEPNAHQEDALTIDVLPPFAQVTSKSRIAVYDPQGETTRLLKQIGISFQPVTPDQATDCDVLVVGRRALQPEGPLPGFDRVRRGLKLLVFEQDADVLARRFGFRINVHGLRQVFARVPAHPAMTGLTEQRLRDWQGSATIVPPYLDLHSVDENDPKWKWCGFENTRVWRCGNRGSVATVLIEKPDRGNFLPLVDGGFDLQYAPLLEYAEGNGRVIFCQLDVTGRTQDDPAAQMLCANLLQYLDNVRPSPSRKTCLAGDERAGELLRQLGIATGAALPSLPENKSLLVLGPGAAAPPDLRKQVEAGLNVLGLGLGQQDLERLLPGVVRCRTVPAVSTLVQRFDPAAFAGVSNAELHWRTRPTIAALQAVSEQSNEALCTLTLGAGQVVLCQAAPWMFDYAKHPYLRTTYRRNVLLVARLLYNLGAACETPTIAAPTDRYLQLPQAEDDPYRYYRW